MQANTTTTKRTPSIQEYNEIAENLIHELKDFWHLETGIKNVIVKSMNKQELLVPMVDFHHRNNTDKFIKRLSEFGFPAPSISEVNAAFLDVVKSRRITLQKDHQGKLLDNLGSLSEVYDALKYHFNEKGIKNLVRLGHGFVRVQNKQMARRATNFLKVKYPCYKFICSGEDILIYTKQATPGITPASYADYLRAIIVTIFKIEIFDNPSISENGIIVGFDSETVTRDAQLYCEYFGISSSARGTTLVFPIEKPHFSIEHIKNEFSKNISEIRETTTTEIIKETISISASGKMSNEDFKRSVCRYVKEKGYKKINNSSQREIRAYTYSMGLKGDLNQIVDQAKIDHPEWIVVIKKSGKYIDFTLNQEYSQKTSNSPLQSHQASTDVKFEESKRSSGDPMIDVEISIPLSSIEKKVLKDVSDESLIKEMKRRGPDFAKKVFTRILSVWQKS